MNDVPVPPPNEEKESGSSSSSGKEESGEGYSADCSGSDHSLDGNRTSPSAGNHDKDAAHERSLVGAKTIQDDEKQQKRSSKWKDPPKEEGFHTWEDFDEDIVPPRCRIAGVPSTPKASTHDGPNERKLPYAQWNGVVVSNPMDQRVDFTTMAMANAAYSEFLRQQHTKSSLHRNEPEKQRSKDVSSVSLESYAKLLEAVRPFFFPQGPVMAAPVAKTANVSSKNAEQTTTSSEGFTSFFTTTDSNTGNSKSPESSEEDKTKQADPLEASSLKVQARPRRQKDRSEHRRVQILVENHINPATVTDARTSSSGTPQESANEPLSSGNDANANDGKTASEDTPTDQQGRADSAVASTAHADDHEHQTDEEHEQHRKRLDKKRKRIEMRREYEAQQQFESSESSDGHKDNFLRPGKPITLEEAMVFSEIPRILILSHVPFTVVHTNAAFSRLTGIDSHFVVGRPISRLLSLEGDTIDSKEHLITKDPKKDGHFDSLNRFLASCANSSIQVMRVNTAVEQIVGRSLILNGPPDNNTVDDKRKEPAGQHEDAKHMLCKVGIAPIISKTNAVSLSNYPPLKIRRAISATTATCEVPQGQIVSHYMIHLKPDDNPLIFQKRGADSISSASSQTQPGLPQLPYESRNSPSSDSSGVATGLVAAVG